MNWGGIAATALGGAVKDLRLVLNLSLKINCVRIYFMYAL